MFSTIQQPSSNLETQIADAVTAKKNMKNKTPPNIYPLHSTSSFSETTEHNVNAIDSMLEKEKIHNKTENWNKLDKTAKIQRLHAFAEKYGKTNGLPTKEIKNLKMFFVDCLEKNKLQKTKDLNYDKDSGDIVSIPALHFNTEMHNFTLRIIDTKRVSTLKSLTPKRTDNLASDNLVVE